MTLALKMRCSLDEKLTEIRTPVLQRPQASIQQDIAKLRSTSSRCRRRERTRNGLEGLAEMQRDWMRASPKRAVRSGVAPSGKKGPGGANKGGNGRARGQPQRAALRRRGCNGSSR